MSEFPPKQSRLLIVDDSLVYRNMLLKFLSTHFDCSIAISGDDALGMVQKQDYDIVISDYEMPGSLNGISFLEKLQQINANTTRILVSEVVGRALEKEDGGVGRDLFHGILQKPIRLELLLGQIHKAVSKHTQMDVARLSLLDATPDPMVVFGDDGLIRWVNPRLEKEFGWKKEDLNGQIVEMLIPKRFHKDHVAFRNQYFLDPTQMHVGSGVQRVGLHRSGREFPIELSVSSMDTPEGRIAIWGIRNIEERLAVEKERLAVEKKLLLTEKKLLEAQALSGIGHWEVDHISKKVHWSGQAIKNFGLNPQTSDPNFKELFKYIPSEDLEKLTLAFQNHLKTGQTFQIQHTLVTKEGLTKILKHQCSTEYDESNKPLHSLGTVRDVTDEVNREAKLKQEVRDRTIELESSKLLAEQANRAKTYFLANMSHEIRTPLNIISGFAKLLIEGREGLLGDQREQLTQIAEASHILTEVIGNILDLSKIESGKVDVEKSNLDIIALIKGIYHINKHVALTKGINFSYGIDSQLPRAIISDRTLLNQALMNLVSNALKFTDKGKKVHLEAKANQGFIKISVEDQGIGLTPDQLNLIFDPFTQADNTIRRRFGGTGLGLSITKKITNLLGGDLNAESVKDQGSTFTLTLPLEKGSLQEEDYQTLPHRTGINILIIDDHPLNQKLLKLFLKGLGHVCLSAENGKLGMETMLESPVDLILLDLHMPIMDGYQVLEQMQQHQNLRLIPTFVTTADAFQNVRVKCSALGSIEFLTKPIDFGILRNLLGKYFPAEPENSLAASNTSSDEISLEGRSRLLTGMLAIEKIPWLEKEAIGDQIEYLRSLEALRSKCILRHLDDLENASLGKSEEFFLEKLKYIKTIAFHD